MTQLGILKGEICNRDGCKGVIDEREKEGGCSCHIHPPCSHCVEDAAFCPECDWSGEDERIAANNNRPKLSTGFSFKVRTLEDLDSSKIDWIAKSHTHFSMIKEGVYPDSATMDDVLAKVKGTFGGRFRRFGNGRFEYIAYTD